MGPLGGNWVRMRSESGAPVLGLGPLSEQIPQSLRSEDMAFCEPGRELSPEPDMHTLIVVILASETVRSKPLVEAHSLWYFVISD